MKNKYRIIQVGLIVIIFLLIGFYWTQASSTYNIVATSDDIVSIGNTDTVKIDSFLEKNILNIHYDVFNNGKQMNDGHLGYRILTSDGNSVDTIPYIYSENSGFNQTEVDVYIDGNVLREEISKRTELVTTFKISFYQIITTSGELTEEVAIGDERTIILNIPKTNTSLSKIGNFTLEPYYVEGHTNLSNLKLTDYNSETNTYDYSLNIKMGEEETLKNYVYDINMLTDSFPFTDMKSLSNTNSVKIETVIDSPYISTNTGKSIKHPVTNKAYDLGNIIKFIISANRLTNTEFLETKAVYSITFNSLSDLGENVHVNLTIDLSMDEGNLGSKNLYETKTNKVINKSIGDNGLIIDMSFEFIPYKLLVKNELNKIVNTVVFEQVTLDEYSNFSEEIFKRTFNFGKDIVSGFYTIEAYGLRKNLELDDENNVILPEEKDIKVLGKYTTYIDTDLSHELIISDNGKVLDISNAKEVNIDVHTDNSESKNVLLLDGFLYKEQNKLDSNFKYKAVSNLKTMEEINDGSVIINENTLTIKGTISSNSIYLLAYPSTGGCFYTYKLNINHIGLKNIELSLSLDGTIFETPFSGANGEVAYLTPNIRENGKYEDISKYDYNYNIYVLSNGNYVPFVNNNIYIEKNVIILNEEEEEKRVDKLTLTDSTPVGNYLIKIALDSYPDISAVEYFKITYKTIPTTPIYSINITNSNLELAVPSSVGKQNVIPITHKVLKDGVETNIVPTFIISGDLKASIKNNNIIIKSGATVGNNIILTANVSNPNDGSILATDSKHFKLVAQNNNNDKDIIDDPENPGGNPGENPGDNPGGNPGDNPGGGSDIENTIPSKITINGYSKDDKSYLSFSKTSGETKTLTYICYDSKGKVITNPSIAISIEPSSATGYLVSTDYKNKKINITSNGLSGKTNITINFKNSDTLIRTVDLELRKSSIYNCSLKILQKDIERTGKITAEATFSNNGLVDLNVLLAVVCYDKNDKIVAKSVTPVIVGSGKSLEKPLESKITLPTDIKDVVVKAFLLDGTSLDDSVGYYTGAVTITNRRDY